MEGRRLSHYCGCTTNCQWDSGCDCHCYLTTCPGRTGYSGDPPGDVCTPSPPPSPPSPPPSPPSPPPYTDVSGAATTIAVGEWARTFGTAPTIDSGAYPACAGGEMWSTYEVDVDVTS